MLSSLHVAKPPMLVHVNTMQTFRHSFETSTRIGELSSCGYRRGHINFRASIQSFDLAHHRDRATGIPRRPVDLPDDIDAFSQLLLHQWERNSKVLAPGCALIMPCDCTILPKVTMAMVYGPRAQVGISLNAGRPVFKDRTFSFHLGFLAIATRPGSCLFLEMFTKDSTFALPFRLHFKVLESCIFTFRDVCVPKHPVFITTQACQVMG